MFTPLAINLREIVLQDDFDVETVTEMVQVTLQNLQWGDERDKFDAYYSLCSINSFPLGTKALDEHGREGGVLDRMAEHDICR